MMHYSKAIKLLYRVENPEVVQQLGGKMERELERMARRKFKFVASMHVFSRFGREKHEKTVFVTRLPGFADCILGGAAEQMVKFGRSQSVSRSEGTRKG